MSGTTTWTLVATAVGHFIIPTLPSLGYGQSQRARASVDGQRPVEVPPGFFFAIWGPIFAAYGVTAASTLNAYLKAKLSSSSSSSSSSVNDINNSNNSNSSINNAGEMDVPLLATTTTTIPENEKDDSQAILSTSPSTPSTPQPSSSLSVLDRFPSTLRYLGLAGVGNCGWLIANQFWGIPALELAVMATLVTPPAWMSARSFALESSPSPSSSPSSSPSPPPSLGSRVLDATLNGVTGALAGWTTVALAISIPRTLRSPLLLDLPVTSAILPMGGIALGAATLGCLTALSHFLAPTVPSHPLQREEESEGVATLASPWYVASWVWGVVGFALSNARTDPTHSAVLGKAAGVGLAGILGYYSFLVWKHWSRSQSRSQSHHPQ